MKRSIIAAALAATTLTACDVSVDQVQTPVSEYNGHSVRIQVPSHATMLDGAEREILKGRMREKATRLCKANGKNGAEYTSQKAVGQGYTIYYYELLYVCL